jgi:hypothetical protein
MEIVDKSEALLTHTEVLEALRENAKMGREASRGPIVLELEKRVRKYLEGTPVKNVKTDEVAELYRRLGTFEPLVCSCACVHGLA